MVVTAIPILLVDLVGSVLMIVFSFLCLDLVRMLKRKDPGNLIWTYLLWVCYGLGAFSVSRSAGHILKQILLLAGHEEIWSDIAAYSGTINTFTLILVASVTLFFERIWSIYGRILSDKRALQEAHGELIFMNQNLEKLVAERTEALARSEKQMVQADRLASIGQLSSGIAHEINNPLGIILGYTQLLLRGEDRESQKYEDLKIIEKHVKNCKAIVEDLLNFARSAPPAKEMVQIHEIIDEGINFIRHHSRLEDVEIVREYDPAVPPLYLDEKKVRQVLVNLMMNARHAVGAAGRIFLSTRWDGEQRLVAIRVEDSGYGIEAKNLPRIFDPFFTTKPTGEGTGLGLSVSYGIIKNHGGEIEVESLPGEGAAFTVWLPAVLAEKTGFKTEYKKGPKGQKGRKGPDGGRERIGEVQGGRDGADDSHR